MNPLERSLSPAEAVYLQARMDEVRPPDNRPPPVRDLCGHCGEPLDPNNRSLYFCDASCQDQWMTQHGEKLVWSNRLPEDDHALSERIRLRLGLGDQGKEVA